MKKIINETKQNRVKEEYKQGDIFLMDDDRFLMLIKIKDAYNLLILNSGDLYFKELYDIDYISTLIISNIQKEKIKYVENSTIKIGGEIC